MSRYLSVSALNQFFVMSFVIAFVLVSFFFNSQATLVAGTLLLAGYALTGLSSYPLTFNVLLLLCLFSMFIVPVFLSFSHGLNVVFYYLSTVFAFFAARRMARNEAVVILSALRFAFYTFFFLCALLYYAYRNEAEPFGAIIEGASTNGIPSYFIVLQVVLSLVTYSVVGRLPLLSAFLTLVIAVLGIGRGSILAAAMIIMASFSFNFLQDVSFKRRGRVILMLGAVIGVLLIGLLEHDILFEYLSAKTNLSRGFYDPARATMIGDYLGQLSVFSAITGKGFEGTVIGELYGGNPHNSFIRAHSYMGLAGLLLILLSPFLVFWMKATLLERIIYFSFVVIMMFRAVSEPILFPTLLDFFYFFVFFFFFSACRLR